MTMKSKSKVSPSTPPAAKKTKTTNRQPTLNAFFTSPRGDSAKISNAKGDANSTSAAKKRKISPREYSKEVINVDSDSDSDSDSDNAIEVVRPAATRIPARDRGPENAIAGPGPSTSAGKRRAGSDDDEDTKLAKQLAREEGWDVDGDGIGISINDGNEASAGSQSHVRPVSHTNGFSATTSREGNRPGIITGSPCKTAIAGIFLKPTEKRSEVTPIREIDKKPSLNSPMKLEPTSQISLHDLSVVKVDPDIAVPDTSPLEFDVDVLMFRPEVVARRMKPWPGGRLPYEVLVGVYVAVGGTRSRLAIVRILTNFLRLLIHHSPQDLLPTIYLLSNHLSPSYIPLELGIGSQVLSKAMTEVSGVGRDGMKRLWDKHGDPGDVAFEAKSNLRTLINPAPLLAHQVYSRLIQIAKTKGNGAGKAKGEIVRRLLVQAKGEEVRYLVRTLVSHLRIGAVRLTLLASLARAFVLTRARTCSVAQTSSEIHATDEELDQVTPLAVKGKGRGKAKEEPTDVRNRIEGKLMEGTAMLRRTYVRHPNYEDIVRALLDGGLDNLTERVPLSVGIPLSPMLGSITRSLAEVFTRLGGLPFTSEAKLDGQRVQIHARLDGPSGDDDGGGRWIKAEEGDDKVWVRLFSRHLEDMTEKYPDVNGLVLAMLRRPPPVLPANFPRDPAFTQPNETMLQLLRTSKVTSFIMDAEIVAVDKDTGAYKTFQELSNRAKKDVQVQDIKVIVGVFAFDLMLINDTPLLNQPFSIRRHLLHTVFPPYHDSNDLSIARFTHVESIDSTNPADVKAFFEMVVSQKCEGLMVKLLENGEGLAGEDDEECEGTIDLDKVAGNKEKVEKSNGNRKKPLPSTYEPDARSQGWLKVKKDYLEGMGDSLDLVPIGAWWGSGRKAGWWSPILLALYNPETGALEAVCKCISGFTDQFYKDLTARYPAEGLPEKCSKAAPLAYVETGGYRPDVWFDPSEVWEIRGADISLSPVYPAAMSHLGGERGLSMRFPRFIRVRDDKTWEEATTAAQFAAMYRKQIAAAPLRDAQPVGASDQFEEDERLDVMTQ